VTSDYMDFECMHCGKLFERTWLHVSRGFERVHYNSPASLDDVEIKDAEGIGTFCSMRCLRLGSPAVMRQEGVPIPGVRPGIGPIEQCAKCLRLVDMSDWHLTYTEGCCEEQVGSIKILDSTTLRCFAATVRRGTIGRRCLRLSLPRSNEVDPASRTSASPWHYG